MNTRKKRKRFSSHSPSATTVTMSDVTDFDCAVDEVDLSVLQPLQAWLKYNDSPHDEVIDKWRKTYNLRKHSVGEENVFAECPLIKHGSLGPQLIIIMFNNEIRSKL